MISFRSYLDTRQARKIDGLFPLKLQVNKRGQTALMPVAVWLRPDQWDAGAQRVTRAYPQPRVINNYLDSLRMKLEDLLRQLILTGEGAPMSAFQVRDWIAARTIDADEHLLLMDYYMKIAKEKKGATRTHFENAWATFVDIVPKLAAMDLDLLDEATVRRIDEGLCQRLAQSTRNTYIAKLCHVMKRAHGEGLIAANPCRGIHLRHVVSKSRALTLDQLRRLLACEPETQLQREALAFFKLSFYLRAMNPIDIARSGPDAIYNGRIRYTRAKTGKDYDFIIEPEAAALIQEWSDDGHLFAPTARYYRSDGDFSTSHVAQELRAISKRLGIPPATMYWARHTFATLMIEIGTPIELVAGAMGHSIGPRITATYVTLREKQIDEAVRRMYDYVAGKENRPDLTARAGSGNTMEKENGYD